MRFGKGPLTLALSPMGEGKRGAAVVSLVLAATIFEAQAFAQPGADCTIDIQPDGGTRVRGRSIELSDESAKALVKECNDIHLVGTEDTPFQRIGEVLVILQKNGYGKVGFITEPPPDTGR